MSIARQPLSARGAGRAGVLRGRSGGRWQGDVMTHSGRSTAQRGAFPWPTLTHLPPSSHPGRVWVVVATGTANFSLSLIGFFWFAMYRFYFERFPCSPDATPHTSHECTHWAQTRSPHTRDAGEAQADHTRAGRLASSHQCLMYYILVCLIVLDGWNRILGHV